MTLNDPYNPHFIVMQILHEYLINGTGTYLRLQWITSKNLHMHALLIGVIWNDLERPGVTCKLFR